MLINEEVRPCFAQKAGISAAMIQEITERHEGIRSVAIQNRKPEYSS